MFRLKNQNVYLPFQRPVDGTVTSQYEETAGPSNLVRSLLWHCEQNLVIFTVITYNMYVTCIVVNLALFVSNYLSWCFCFVSFWFIWRLHSLCTSICKINKLIFAICYGLSRCALFLHFEISFRSYHYVMFLRIAKYKFSM